MLRVRFSTDNDAFQDDVGYEVRRILHKIGDQVLDGHRSGKVLDVNGNTVGQWHLAEEA